MRNSSRINLCADFMVALCRSTAVRHYECGFVAIETGFAAFVRRLFVALRD